MWIKRLFVEATRQTASRQEKTLVVIEREEDKRNKKKQKNINQEFY